MVPTPAHHRQFGFTYSTSRQCTVLLVSGTIFREKGREGIFAHFHAKTPSIYIIPNRLSTHLKEATLPSDYSTE
jgi:hypothetical protein